MVQIAQLNIADLLVVRLFYLLERHWDIIMVSIGTFAKRRCHIACYLLQLGSLSPSGHCLAVCVY